jgi:hypothetical protein
MLRAQPVIDRDHGAAGRLCKLGADVIVAFQPADDEAATVIIDHRHWSGAFGQVSPLWYRAAGAVDGFVRHHYPGRAGLAKGGAHLVIDPALVLDAELDGVRRVIAIGPGDKIQHLRVGDLGRHGRPLSCIISGR